MGMPLDYIQGLNTSDVNRSNAMTNMANVIGDMEYKRGATAHNAATLAADSAYKAEVNRIANEKAKWEALKDRAAADKDYVLMQKSIEELKKLPLEMQKLQSEYSENMAQAGSAGRANRDKKAGYNPKTGKYEWFDLSTGKSTGVRVPEKEISDSGGRSGNGKLDESAFKIQNSLNDLMIRNVGTDKDPNIVRDKTIDRANYVALQQVAKSKGEELRIVELPAMTIPSKGRSGRYKDVELEKVEIPVVVSSMSKKQLRDYIIEKLVKVHKYDRDDAIIHVDSIPQLKGN